MSLSPKSETICLLYSSSKQNKWSVRRDCFEDKDSSRLTIEPIVWVSSEASLFRSDDLLLGWGKIEIRMTLVWLWGGGGC